jgi:hypothetical protein
MGSEKKKAEEKQEEGAKKKKKKRKVTNKTPVVDTTNGYYYYDWLKSGVTDIDCFKKGLEVLPYLDDANKRYLRNAEEALKEEPGNEQLQRRVKKLSWQLRGSGKRIAHICVAIVSVIVFFWWTAKFIHGHCSKVDQWTCMIFAIERTKLFVFDMPMSYMTIVVNDQTILHEFRNVAMPFMDGNLLSVDMYDISSCKD